MATLKVGILGASGYAGGELLRLLLLHPYAQVRLATSQHHFGQRVDELHPNLSGLTDLVLSENGADCDWQELDCLFLAWPHGKAMVRLPQILPRMRQDARIIDLSGDFRLRNGDNFHKYYGLAHPAPALQREFVYGLSEVFREQIASARKVANPGCFATAGLLGLYPLLAAGLVAGRVVIDAKTGSSGSGAQAKPITHHPRRSNSFTAYKPFVHQHRPEVMQALRCANSGWRGNLVFQTHSAPFVRGIFASIYCSLKRSLSESEVAAVFRGFFNGSPLVRLREGSPDVLWVKNSCFADIGWAVQGRELIVFTAIDNLLKGAAGQAVQNMNLMFGFPEETGILLTGCIP